MLPGLPLEISVMGFMSLWHLAPTLPGLWEKGSEKGLECMAILTHYHKCAWNWRREPRKGKQVKGTVCSWHLPSVRLNVQLNELMSYLCDLHAHIMKWKCDANANSSQEKVMFLFFLCIFERTVNIGEKRQVRTSIWRCKGEGRRCCREEKGRKWQTNCPLGINPLH